MPYDVLFIAIFFFFHYSILNYKNEIFARLHEYDAFHFILGSRQFYQHVFFVLEMYCQGIFFANLTNVIYACSRIINGRYIIV